MKNVRPVLSKKLITWVMTVSSFSLASSAWAMSAPGGQEGQGSGGGFALFMPMILVFLIFYFLLIRPQSKQQKKHQALLKEIKRGDLVVTSSGIHGKIASVTDAMVGVEIAENVRIKMDKKQVAQVVSSQPEK